MSTPTRRTPERLPSAELRDVRRRLKQGYRLERTRGGHYRIRGRDGRLVEDADGKVISLMANPSPGVLQAWDRQLTEAQVFKGTGQRPFSPEAEDARIAGFQKMREEREARRKAEADALRERMAAAFKNAGGLDVPGLTADMGRVGARIALDQGKEGMTPDLLASSATRLIQGNWVEPRYQEVWRAMLDELEKAPTAAGEWWTLVRDARGLPADSVQLRMPRGAEADGFWPFRVELLPLDALLVDPAYQRPAAWSFIRREAARFDAALVGTVDVAQRSPSQFAILDGQQRSEIVRLVGGTTIYCSVYTGLDLASEARFFLHKNKDRKTVHPYYTFKARLTSADPDAIQIDRIVTELGYVLAIGAPRAGAEDHIAAIAAVEAAYQRKRPDGTDSLTPVLSLLRISTFGRSQGQNSILIRGLSVLFANYAEPDLDPDVLKEVLTSLGPDLILGRARDLARNSGGNAESACARVLADEYDKHTGRGGSKLRWKA